VLNPDAEAFDIRVEAAKFRCGLHCDAQRNYKELITPFQVEQSVPLEFYMSKVPIKFKAMPLTLMLNLQVCTPMKLQLSKGRSKLYEPAEEGQPEYHELRFEALIQEYTNSIDDIVKMRNRFRIEANTLAEGRLPEARDWTLTNIDRLFDLDA